MTNESKQRREIAWRIKKALLNKIDESFDKEVFIVIKNGRYDFRIYNGENVSFYFALSDIREYEDELKNDRFEMFNEYSGDDEIYTTRKKGLSIDDIQDWLEEQGAFNF